MPSPTAYAACSSQGSGSTSTISVKTATGRVMFEIKGYSQIKGLGIAKRIKSDTFTVGGHKWCVTYFPDGLSEHTADWVGVALRLEHPAENGNIMVRAKYSLLDQFREPVLSYTRSSGGVWTFSGTFQNWGYPQFIKRKDLESSYVKDDKFCIRCDVTVLEQIHVEKSSMVPPSDLQWHLSNLLASRVGADMTLEVGGETLAVHKNVLAARLPLFRGFPGDGTRTCSLQNHVRVHGIEVRVLKAMLHFIYTDSLPEIDEADKRVMAQHLHVAADRYNAERLKLVCEDILCRCMKNTGQQQRSEYDVISGSSPACAASGHNSGSMSTGWHVLKVDGYSHIKEFGGAVNFKSSTFMVGGHEWCITHFPDDCSMESTDWICLALQLKHHAADGEIIMVRIKYSLLDEFGEPVPSYTLCDGYTFSRSGETSCHLRFMKRGDIESTYVKDDKFWIRCDITITEKICAEGSSTVPPPDLHKHLGDLLVSGAGADVTLEVSGSIFVAHKNILAARSSVFKAEFFGGLLKEKVAAHVRIDGIEATVFEAMLHFIYTDSFPKIDKHDKLVVVQHLLVAADRYNMERLKFICEDILCTYMNSSIVGSTLVLAEQHGFHRLKDVCFKFLQSYDKFKQFLMGDDFRHATKSCPSLLCELFAKVGPVISSSWKQGNI